MSAGELFFGIMGVLSGAYLLTVVVVLCVDKKARHQFLQDLKEPSREDGTGH